ncbi:aldehyde dehydrogenase family protein [Pokkaliibacter sp. MBI-7]|uniref:aldehyde dehydrogenase family protein n=1 Tax=Pokkaliibacter sp. MBI-7 TaxID=3040600 RepID=UPI0024476D9E|nr:aldehyde dehydrogenase family protein [Pokkaliibacter sp. MBI-7]MDH2435490.1 aldehyde dehydrogenase family protein [Pokkaliibacter sp. MBI-7]
MPAQSQIAVLESVQAFLQRQHGLYIDGKQQESRSGQRLQVCNPATGQVIGSIAQADSNEVDTAVRSAQHAFTSGIWSALRPADRERILLKVADVLEAHSEELAQLETLNQGKSIHIARAIEVGATIEFVRYMAGWATKIGGETMDVSIPVPQGARYTAYTRREPIGVVGAIVPWNFPLMIATWKIIPALAAGCTVVLKPSEETPLTALRLAELLTEAGVPDGVVNVITGDGKTTGEALITHPLISKLTFTGSTSVGKRIGHAAVDQMARFTLELGGKNPLIIMDDADIAQVVPGVMMGGLLNQGQVCAAASRIYVQRSHYEVVLNALIEAVKGMSIGPGMDPDARINPVVSRRHQQSIYRFLEQAKAEGVQVHQGCKVPEGEGFYVEPTILSAVDHSHSIIHSEVFGPVLAVMPFDTEDEVLALANDSHYGLAASLWTTNLNTAMRMVPKIKSGTVWVNTHVPLDPAMPFGGHKQSGMGREFGKGAVESFTEIKSVCIAHD